MNIEEIYWKIDKSCAKHKYFIKIETDKEVYSFDGVPLWIVSKILSDKYFNNEEIMCITIEPYTVDWFKYQKTKGE